MPGYANPMEHALINARERVDDGVDFSVYGGYLSALCDCVVTQGARGGWGRYGNYVEYLITDGGALDGMHVFYAEGVTVDYSPGTRLIAGQRVCGLIPHWPTGIEIGWAAGVGYSSWASVYGGGHHRTENTSTQAGISFNRLLGLLGAPQGNILPDIQGTAPNLDFRGIREGGGGGKPPPSPLPDADVSDYDPSPIIRNAWWTFGTHGARAYNNANSVRLLVDSTNYCTTGGAK